jgi:NAD(P)-dependent dehydrogenase (short-subunit alcohol dehydrogenase family)
MFFIRSSRNANDIPVYPSEMSSGIIAGRGDTKWPKSMIPEERTGDAEDIVGAVMFLVSKAGAYINGNRRGGRGYSSDLLVMH